jgi:hypothetical protein
MEWTRTRLESIAVARHGLFYCHWDKLLVLTEKIALFFNFHPNGLNPVFPDDF